VPHNPHRRVTGISVGKHADDFWIRLEINRTEMLSVETRGLTAHQAEILGDGYLNGLQWGDCLPQDIIEMLSNDPLEMPSLQGPLRINPADRALFKRGTAGALELAANGYWLDDSE
jgi:hypothetical protein